MTRRADIAKLSRHLADRAEAFCHHFFPNGRKQGNYWQIADTTGAAGQSLSIRLNAHGGKQAGKWVDYAGTDEFGDLIDLLHANLGNGNFGETLRVARSWLGQPETERDYEPKQDTNTSPAVNANKTIAAGKKLFSIGKPLFGTIAQSYLVDRAIERFGPALRYHSTVFVRADDRESNEPEKHPALLAKITDNDGLVTGCARTFLDASTNKLAGFDNPKRVLGQLHGNAIRFGTGSYCEDLIVGEGLENVLSVGTALTELDLASCLTANHLGMFIPSTSIKRLWIARDKDDAGERGAHRLRSRAEPLGIMCTDLVPRLEDFNKDLLESGKDDLRRVLLKAMMEKGFERLSA